MPIINQSFIHLKPHNVRLFLTFLTLILSTELTLTLNIIKHVWDAKYEISKLYYISIAAKHSVHFHHYITTVNPSSNNRCLQTDSYKIVNPRTSLNHLNVDRCFASRLDSEAGRRAATEQLHVWPVQLSESHAGETALYLICIRTAFLTLCQPRLNIVL